MAARPRQAQGFTLVEMLVVITIIGTLAAMLLPAIQAAREAGRAVVCRSHLANVFHAVDQYEQTNNKYPGHENEIGTVGRKGSWVVPLLPYLDATSTYDQWASLPVSPNQAAPTIYIEILTCPSDASQAEPGFPALSYVANAGWGETVGLTGGHLQTESIFDGLFPDRYDDINTFDNTDNRKLNLNKDTVLKGDGLQYTLMFSENLHDARKPGGVFANTWTAIEPPNGDTSIDATYTVDLKSKRYTVFVWFTQETIVDKPNGDKYNAVVTNASHEAARPASFHPGGVQVTLAGGNTQFMSDSVDYRVFRQLCTTNDKKSAALQNVWNVVYGGTGGAYPKGLPPLSDADFQ